MIMFDPTELVDQILFVNMLLTCNLRYFRYLRYFKSILFSITINLDVALSSKVFSSFDYLFLSIVLLTRINKFNSFKKNNLLIKKYLI